MSTVHRRRSWGRRRTVICEYSCRLARGGGVALRAHFTVVHVSITSQARRQLFRYSTLGREVITPSPPSSGRTEGGTYDDQSITQTHIRLLFKIFVSFWSAKNSLTWCLALQNRYSELSIAIEITIVRRKRGLPQWPPSDDVPGISTVNVYKLHGLP